MISLKIKKLAPNAQIPKRMTSHSAGYDLFSANKEKLVCKEGESVIVPTGIAIHLPEGFEAQIRPRSGLAARNQVTVLNSPGTIDPDYRGEIKVILINHGKEDFVIEPHKRIAQILIHKFETVEFIETDLLESTQRNDGGFGHTDS